MTITAKKLTAAVLKVMREAGCPVMQNQLPKFVARELGAEVSDEAVIGCAIALRAEGKVMCSGRFRGSPMIELAW